MNDEVVKVKTVDFSANEESFKGKATFEAPPEVIAGFCQAMTKVLADNSAANFVEFKMRRPNEATGYILTIQRENGKTPAELKTIAENRVLALHQSIENLLNNSWQLADLSAVIPINHPKSAAYLIEVHELIQALGKQALQAILEQNALATPPTPGTPVQ